MPTPQQTRAIQRYSEEVWGKGNVDAIDEIFTADAVRHGPALEGGASEGAKGKKELVELYRTAFPDLQVPVEAMAGEGDIVLSRWRATATNSGSMLGNPATGKSVDIFGFWMHRFEGDQIAEEWVTWDTQGFLQQLGAPTA